jgi:plasmid stability protein
MKLSIDLPDDLVRRLKRHAARDGRRLEDLAADILRSGLAGNSHTKGLSRAIVRKDSKTGLPVIQCPRTPSRGEELTADCVARILLQQEVEWASGSA